MRLQRVAFAAAALCLEAFVLTAAGLTYTYDSLNRLTRVSYPDGSTIAYTYDSAGNRLSQVITNSSVQQPTVGIDKTSLSFTVAAGQTSQAQAVLVSNTGGGTLQWTAVPSASWLTVTSGSGTNGGAFSVTASAANLQPGSYNASIQILASASNAPFTITVTLTVTAASGNPTISSGGIISAAGFLPGITRGSVASIFGTSLATGAAQALDLPLPFTLGKVQVSVNGVNAPLWYVSPGQINLQVPFEAPLQGQASFIVTSNASASIPVNVTLVPYAPSVFTYERIPGVFDPIIVHLATNLLVTPDSPAVPGEYIVVYGTGIGDLTVLPATGALSPTSPLAAARITPTATIGGANAYVQFAGLTPGSIGLAQFNIQLPNSLPAGSTLPLVINFAGSASQPVNLAVQSSSPAKVQ